MLLVLTFMPIIQRPSNIELDPQIKTFVVLYLNPKAKLLESHDAWSKMLARVSTLDWPLVDDLIQRLDYDSYFLRTLYWRIVARHVKERDRWTCCRCGRGGALEAHHQTYDHHGSEHLHLDDLETLCAVCHCLHHDLVVQAIIYEHELTPRTARSVLEKLDRSLDDGIDLPDGIAADSEDWPKQDRPSRYPTTLPGA